MSGDCPRSRAFAGRPDAVTERSEGNPRSGLTAPGRSAALATARAGTTAEDSVQAYLIAHPLLWLTIGGPRTRDDAEELRCCAPGVHPTICVWPT
jgi:hypothetical protein